ncbi:MAG: NUDIX domain-containing protein [Candidatus Diapherotrites archaeon]|nr:NUDIX domain-containing protein [Candidatus Diapherotrites archaeon]
MPKSKIVIVDETDKIIGSKYNADLKSNDIYRVSALWVTNSKGEILLAKRHHTKAHDPNKWGPAVAGTVEENETYEENIVKEAEEELGIKNCVFSLGPKLKRDNQYHYFVQWYFLKIDQPVSYFKPQETEVEEVKWFSPDDLQKQMEKNPENFLLSLRNYAQLFL